MAQVKDVVCGMTVDSQKSEYKSQYMGKTYSFCSAGCKRTFDQDPEKYAGAQETGQSGQRP